MPSQRDIDEEAIRRSAQDTYAGKTSRAAHQALLDAFRTFYGVIPMHSTPAARWIAYPTTTPGLKP